MWSDWRTKVHFTLHIRGFSALPALGVPPLKSEPPTHTHMHRLWRKCIFAELCWARLFCCRADKQTAQEFFGVSITTDPTHTRQDQPAAAAWFPFFFYQLRVWLLPSSPSRLKSWKIDEQSERGAVSQVLWSANGSSRHILTGPVSSWLNSYKILGSFSLLILPSSSRRAAAVRPPPFQHVFHNIF